MKVRTIIMAGFATISLALAACNNSGKTEATDSIADTTAVAEQHICMKRACTCSGEAKAQCDCENCANVCPETSKCNGGEEPCVENCCHAKCGCADRMAADSSSCCKGEGECHKDGQAGDKGECCKEQKK